MVRDRASLAFNAWLASFASPTTTISSSYGGALPFLVDAVHIDALGLNTPYIARHGTFDPDGPQDSKTDMRWVIEQRPDIVEGYLSGLALLRGAGPDEIIGARRRKMILEMLSSPRFQREYVFVRNAPYDGWTGPCFCAATSGRRIRGATTLDCVPVAETALAASRAGECAPCFYRDCFTVNTAIVQRLCRDGEVAGIGTCQRRARGVGSGVPRFPVRRGAGRSSGAGRVSDSAS